MAVTLVLPACSNTVLPDSPNAVQQSLRARKEFIIHRAITAWYRLCTDGSTGTESAIVIWPATIQLKVDLRPVTVTGGEHDVLHVSVGRASVEGIHPALGLSDTMLSPIELNLDKEQGAAVAHYGSIEAVSALIATDYFLVSQQGRVALKEAIKESVISTISPTAPSTRSIEIDLPDATDAVAPPKIELCPGSLLLVNGVPVLRSHADQVETVRDDLVVPLVGPSPQDSLPRDASLLATTFLVPDFRGLYEPLALKKIANGTRASPGEFPFAVALAVEDPPHVYSQYCGGSLIEKDLVLTAAHCTVALGHVAIIGAVDLNDLHDPNVEVIPIKPSRPANTAPGYGDAAKFDADLQLVKLERASHAQTAHIATAAATPGDQLTAIGWGLTESGKRSWSLMEALLTVNDLGHCMTHYAQKIQDSPHYWGITPHMMCVGGGKTATCAGDSGGPLLSGNQIVATDSFGDPCTTGSAKQAPTMFIRLLDYPDFLPR